jgi:hypothetical protein
MHGKASDVVRVGLERGDLFVGIVIEDTELKVIGSSNKPIFTCNKFDTAYWYF